MRGPRAAQAWPSPQEQNPRGGRDRGHRRPRRLSPAAAGTAATLAPSSATAPPPVPIPTTGSGTTGASALSSLSSTRHAIPRRVRSRSRFFLFFIILLFITSASFQRSTPAATACNEHLFFSAPRGLLSRTGARWCQQHLPAVAAIFPLPLPSLPSERRRAAPVPSALPVPLPPRHVSFLLLLLLLVSSDSDARVANCGLCRDDRPSVPSVSGTTQAQPSAAVSFFFVSTTRPGADHQQPRRRPK